MSNKEVAISLLDKLDENKTVFIINMMRNLVEDKEPNEETIAAMNGEKIAYHGTGHDLLSEIAMEVERESQGK